MTHPTCPKCSKVVTMPFTWSYSVSHVGSTPQKVWALYCPDAQCAAILGFMPAPAT